MNGLTFRLVLIPLIFPYIPILRYLVEFALDQIKELAKSGRRTRVDARVPRMRSWGGSQAGVLDWSQLSRGGA
jgi:hypothetical protein